MKWITTTDAARIIGCDPRHVRWLASQGRLVAQTFADRWQISETSAKKFARTTAPTGRKRKSAKV